MGTNVSVHSVRPPKVEQLPNTQQLLDVDDAVDPLRNFNLSTPSAAVIGAGIAGVHAAYELAKLGFAVTVFDEKTEIAAGATQYSLPFVGVGLVKPFLSHLSLRDEFFKGLLPASCPAITTREHVFNSLFSTPLHRWVLARSRCTFSADEVMFYTNNLSRLSHQTVTQLASEHVALQQHIRPCNVAVHEHDAQRVPPAAAAEAAAPHGRRKEGDALPLVPAATAHPKPLMVDPVGWTRTLADICRDQMGVRFALGEKVEGFRTYLKYDVETTRSIQVSRPDPDDATRRVYADEIYDVTVLAAGAGTGPLTTQTARLPITGLSGVSVNLSNTAGGALDGVRKLFPTASPTDEAALVVLSGPCSLFGYRFTPRAPLGSAGDGAASPPRDFHAVSGLLSVDATRASGTAAGRHLARLESYLRVMCDLELPLVEAYGASLTGPSGDAARVTAATYTRAFTPDGVPLIDHCGGAFNTFVCSGFGDQAMDFAPGSARILGQLVKHQAEVLLHEDANRQRAVGLMSNAAADASAGGEGRIVALPLPPSRLQEAERDMQCLLNGVLPPAGGAAGRAGQGACTARRWLAQLTGGWVGSDPPRSGEVGELPVQDWRQNGLPSLPSAEQRASDEFRNKDGELELYFQGNPYSTNRFRGVVEKGFRDITLYTPWSYVTSLETALFNWMDPLRQRINRAATNYARRDGVPLYLQDFVYLNMYYDRDDEERHQRETDEARASRLRVLAMHESDPDRGAQLVEQSKVAEVARNRRAREATASQLHVPGTVN